MPWLIELLIPISTAIIGYISKHKDEYIEQIFAKLGTIISNKIGNDTAAIIISTEPNVFVDSDNGDGEILKRKSNNEGCVEFKENLKRGDTLKLTAYGEGYNSKTTEIKIDNVHTTYCVVLKLDKKEGI